jgi:hypothetical protein
MPGRLEAGGRLAQPCHRLSPAVAERALRDQPPGEMIPPRRKRGERLSAPGGERLGAPPVTGAASQHGAGVPEAPAVPAHGGPDELRPLDLRCSAAADGRQQGAQRPRPTARDDRDLGRRVVSARPARGIQHLRRVLASPAGVLHRLRDVVPEQGADHAHLTDGGQQDLRIAGLHGLGAPGALLDRLRVTTDPECQALQAVAKRLEPRRADEACRALQPLCRLHRPVGVGTQAEQVGELEVDRGRDGEQASRVGQVSHIDQFCRVEVVEHADGGDPVQRCYPPDA